MADQTAAHVFDLLDVRFVDAIQTELSRASLAPSQACRRHGSRPLCVQLADYLEAPLRPWQRRLWAAADPNGRASASSVQQALDAAAEAGLHAGACAAMCDAHPALPAASARVADACNLVERLPASLHSAACRADMQGHVHDAGRLCLDAFKQQHAAVCQAVRCVLQDLRSLRVLQLEVSNGFIASAAAMQEANALVRAASSKPGIQVHILMNAGACWAPSGQCIAASLERLMQAAAPALTALDTNMPGSMAGQVHEAVGSLPVLSQLSIGGEWPSHIQARTASACAVCDGVCSILCKGPMLTHLQLRLCCEGGCEQLQLALCALSALQHLQLPATFDFARLPQVPNRLQQLTHLEIFLLARDKLLDTLRTVSGLRTLRSLDITAVYSVCLMRDLLHAAAGVNNTPGLLRQLTALTSLRLGAFARSHSGIKASGEAGSIASLKGLHHLQLQEVGMCHLGRAHVLQDTAGSLQSVSMVSCRDDVADSIAQGTSAMTALTSLEVSSVQGDGLLALAHKLAALSALQSLHMRECALGDGGAEALAAALPQLRRLTSLSLCQCKVFSRGAVCISKGLQELTALQALDLSRNGIGTVGARALVVRAAGLPQLQSLRLSCDGVVGPLLHELQLQLPHVPWLQALTP